MNEPSQELAYIHKQKESQLFLKGFSILEVVLSLFVLSVGLVTVLSLTNSSISETVDSRDSLIASALVQEGVELVRNVRDNNAAQAYNAPGTHDIFEHFSPSSICIVDFSTVDNYIYNPGTSPFDCVASNKRLGLNADDRFVHGAANLTDFRREIRFSSFDDALDPQSIDVVSVVTWGNTALPSGVVNAANCSLKTNCVFDTTTFTSWILR